MWDMVKRTQLSEKVVKKLIDELMDSSNGKDDSEDNMIRVMEHPTRMSDFVYYSKKVADEKTPLNTPVKVDHGSAEFMLCFYWC